MDPKETMTWKKTFFKSNFSVDQCLANYTQKSDLETLRRDLKNYGTDLQVQMSEILKSETEAIVNLAEYLTNLNSKIDNLSVPISQLREEIRTLHDLITTAEDSYKSMLVDIKNNNLKQKHINLKLEIISSSTYVNSVIDTIESNLNDNLLSLERIINKYSFEKTYLDDLQLMTPDIEAVVNNVEKKLVKNINNSFLNAFKNGDRDTLLRCLRMYVNLQQQNEAHKIFQKNVIKLELQHLFTVNFLEKCNYDLDVVDIIYAEVVKVLDTKVQVLSDIVKDNSDLFSFNFVLNSFWREFDTQSREGLPNITAPGNPERFQKRFTSTYNLLKHIAEKSGEKNLLKEDMSFQNHLKRFNLPVYFEIKFQQIAGNFESDSYNIQMENIMADKNDNSFKLKISAILWNALIACFHEDVYIDQLADQFIRLSMMLISRYIKILEKLLKDHTSSESKEMFDDFIINALIDLSIIQSLVAPKYTDISQVEHTKFSLINKNMWHIMLKVFRANEKTIEKVQETFKTQLITAKAAECSAQLQNVTAIPRLYRRTNRSPPKEASSYVVEAVKPILLFHDRFKNKLGKNLEEINNKIVFKITNQYLSLVQEVLNSVCKTEESLRRLKNRTLNASGDDMSHGPSDTMSDEMKIREQIKYDVGYFVDKLYLLSLSSAKEAMDALKKEVCQ